MYLKFISFLFRLTIIGAACCLPASASAETTEPVVVRMVVDGPSDIYAAQAKQIAAEIAYTFGARPVRFLFDEQSLGDWTLDGANRALDAAYAEPGVDLVLAGGLLMISAVAKRPALPRPTILHSVVDMKLQGVPF
jgi:hypothetical protein